MIFKIFLFTVLLLFSSAVLSVWNIKYTSLFGFVGYFFLTIYCLKKFSREASAWQILLMLLIIRCLVSINVVYGYVTGETWSLPMFLLHLIGIASGFLFLRLMLPFNVLPFFAGCLLALFMFFQGWDLWIHKYNFGTFTGKVKSYDPPARFEGFDEEKNLLTGDDFNGKIVLLDFWTTTCGLCFQKFPQLQAVHNKFKQDSSVMILAVNTPIEEDKPNQAFNDIRKEGHTFPVVVTKDEDLAEKFGVKGYPTTFIINPNRQIVYKGDIEGAVKMVDELKSNSR